MTYELKPVKCKECGKAGQIYGGESSSSFHIRCNTFFCWEGPAKNTKQEAVKSWDEVMGGGE